MTAAAPARVGPGRLLAFAVAALGAVVAASCGGQKRAGPARETVPVTVGTVARQAVPLEVSAIGNVQPYRTVAVTARVGGQLTRVDFREGQDVHMGDVLFVLDRRPYEAALAQARANLDRDRARATKAEQDQRRYAELVAKDYVTRSQADQADSDASAARATVKADEAAVQTAELDLSYCTIAAPISGRVGSFLLHAGNVVKANDDKPLVVINQVQPVYVKFAVPETSLARIKQHIAGGRPLEVSAAPSDDPTHQEIGELSFLDNAVNATTGTIELKATFANPKQTLWPGQFVMVSLVLSTDADAIVVPSQAVQSGQKGSFVFVVKPDLTVEARPVEVARTRGTLSVVAKGLQAGERVVTDGQLRLSPGATVEIKPSEGSSS
jgi:membrane fusion protein, multidrug efflux system